MQDWKTFSYFIVFFLFFLTQTYSAPDNSEHCKLWFKQHGLKPGQDCVLKCATTPADLGSFDCPTECDRLCGRLVIQKDDKYFKKSPNTSGLCRDEIFNLAISPLNSQKAKSAAQRAFELTEKYFKPNRADDESDAFRHFMWSALIAKETSVEFARQFTGAHESCVTVDVAQTMDLHNNEMGVKTAEKLRKENQLTEQNLIQEGLRLIKEKNLIVIKPRMNGRDMR